MYKKNRLLIVLTIIGMLCFNMNVNAASTYDTVINGSIGSSYIPSGTIDDAYSKGAFITDNSPGVRITLVDINGNRISGTKTIDYYKESFDVLDYGMKHYVGNSYKTQVTQANYSGYSDASTSGKKIIGNLPGISVNIGGQDYDPDFGPLVSYFSSIIDEFRTKIEETKNSSIDEKIKVLSTTNLGKLMSLHGYEWKKESIEELCTSKTSGGVYLIYEPILNIIVGNKYAYRNENINDSTITQNELKAYKKMGSSIGSCTLNGSKTQITCTGLDVSKIQKFITSEIYDDIFKDNTNKNYLEFLLNEISSTGKTSFTVNESNTKLFSSLVLIDYINGMIEQSKKAIANRIYFTGTITEISSFTAGYEKNLVRFRNSDANTFLHMTSELKEENGDKFHFSTGVGGRTSWSSLFTTNAGNGINAIQIYTNQSFMCGNKCVVKEIDGEVSKVYFNGEEMTEKDNKCCYSTGYDSTETYNKLKGSSWYRTTCMENTYCKVSDITEANKKCCTDLSSYSPEDKEMINRHYGNNLLNYIKEADPSKYNICVPPTGCRYSIETQCPDCQLRNEGKIYDAVNDSVATDYDLSDEDLNCIFKNSSYSTGLGSKYCPVSCVENVEYDLPEDNKIYNSGRYITVGEGGTFSPIEISNEKVCRIEYVNYDLFETELISKNKELEIAYDRYMIQKTETTIQKSSECYYNVGFKCCRSTEYKCTNWEEIKDENDKVIGYGDCISGYSYCSVGDNTQLITFTTTYVDSGKYTDLVTHDESYIEWNVPNFDARKAARIKDKLDNVEKINRELNGILNAYEKCFSIKDRMETAPFEPEIYLNYDHGSYSLSNINLVKSETSSITSLNDATTLEKKLSIYRFNASSKTLTSYPYNKYKFVGEAKRVIYSAYKEAKFKLPTEGMYVSVDKQTGISKKENGSTTAYIGPHLPVKYNSKVTDNNITLNIATLGSSNKFESKFRSSCDEYKCKFIINQDIIDTGSGLGLGLDVIYRPISLSNPFPDESGRGRQTGKNWCAEDDCSNNNSVVQSVILNNRGVSGERIYFDLDPLYTVTLTPANIRWIREYNKGRDYTDFSLRKETTADGEKWKSTFLEELNVTGCAYSNYTGRCREGDVY